MIAEVVGNIHRERPTPSTTPSTDELPGGQELQQRPQPTDAPPGGQQLQQRAQPEGEAHAMDWTLAEVDTQEMVPWDGYGPRPTKTPPAASVGVGRPQGSRTQLASLASAAVTHARAAQEARSRSQEARSRLQALQSRLDQAERSAIPRRTVPPSAAMWTPSLVGMSAPPRVLPHSAQRGMHNRAAAGGVSTTNGALAGRQASIWSQARQGVERGQQDARHPSDELQVVEVLDPLGSSTMLAQTPSSNLKAKVPPFGMQP